MKRYLAKIMALVAVLCLATPFAAFARKEEKTEASAPRYSVSGFKGPEIEMAPTEAQKEELRWVKVYEDERVTGYYDPDTLHPAALPQTGYDLDRVFVTARVIYSDDKKTAEHFRESYKGVLGKKEKVQKGVAEYRFDLPAKTYTVLSFALYTDKGRVIEEMTDPGENQAVEYDTFEAALWAVCAREMGH